MAGLLSNQGAESNPGGAGGPSQEIEATPEEQAIFEQYIAASIGAILNNESTFQSLMKALEASKSNPADNIARIALSMYEKAENKLGPLEDDDLTEAVGEAIIEELLDLAVQAKVFTEDQITEDLAAAIYTKLAQSWIEQNPNRADPEDINFIQQQQARGQA